VAHGAPDRTACVEVQREICARIAAFVPAIDFSLVCTESGGNGFFGGIEVGPSGSGGDISFAIKAFAKLIVGAADVLVERVATALFVACEIVAIA
jgi:hypothetical protein